MRTVVLETSAALGEVALADAGGILVARSLPTARKHARDLVPISAALWREVGWEPRSIERIFVDVGPGSYTGLRVGIMVAKTLAYVAGEQVGIIGVEAPAALVRAAPPESVLASTIIDAQQGRVYHRTFRRPPGSTLFEPVSDHQIELASIWADRLEPSTFVTGPALERYRDLVPAHCSAASPEACQPTASAVWDVGNDAWRAGRRDDYWSLEPLYLRSSAAEEKWILRHPNEGS